MENWEREFEFDEECNWSFITQGECSCDCQIKKEVLREYINNIIKQTRQDTLRQVLPEKLGESTTSYGFGCDDMIKRIIDKAKELWGIELNNLNK